MPAPIYLQNQNDPWKDWGQGIQQLAMIALQRKWAQQEKELALRNKEIEYKRIVEAEKAKEKREMAQFKEKERYKTQLGIAKNKATTPTKTEERVEEIGARGGKPVPQYVMTPRGLERRPVGGSIVAAGGGLYRMPQRTENAALDPTEEKERWVRGPDIVVGDKIVKTQKNTKTGKLQTLGSDGTTVTVNTGFMGEAPAPPKPGETEEETITIWDMAEKGTGPWSAAKAAGSTVSGMFGGPVAGETLKARQYIQTNQNELIRALSINPRFPVGEINRLREEINLSPTVFDNPAAFRKRAEAIDAALRVRLRNEISAAADPNLPVEQRRAGAAAAKDIGNFLKILGVPKGAAVPTVSTEAEYNKLKPGQEYIDPNGKKRIKK